MHIFDINYLFNAKIERILKCNRTTYLTWENNIVMIPLKVADELAMYYNSSLAYVLGVEKHYKVCHYKKMDYNKLLENLLILKIKNRQTYEDIAKYLNCNKSTYSRYLSGKVVMKIDTLISIAKYYNVNIQLQNINYYNFFKTKN